jgi:hypothetical protein
MKLSRITYFFYYLKKLDRRKLRLFLNYAATVTGKSKLSLLSDAVASVFIYNIAILDYFQFRFFEKDKSERKLWAGTGYLYEYQLKMNPKDARMLLENKIQFLNYCKKYVKRRFADIHTLESDQIQLQSLLDNKAGKLVLKGSMGQVGAEVEVIKCSGLTPSSLLEYMKKNRYDLAEEYVVQHPALMELSPSGLNTVRVFTQLSNGNVDILGARLRVSVNSPVDNMAAGNPAAPVDLKTGIVSGPGVYSDITKEDKEIHPVTGIAIKGFQIPFWNEVIEIAKNAALSMPQNKSIGWDIAISEKGPELIEGNHNWCKLLWQLPVKKGMKKELEKYL